MADFDLIKKEMHDDQIINTVPNDQERLINLSEYSLTIKQVKIECAFH